MWIAGVCGYLVIGLALAEGCVWASNKQGSHSLGRDTYLVIVGLWPFVFIAALCLSKKWF